MKKFRKEFLFVLCFCMMLGLAACGRDDMNNTTDGNGGVVDDLGDAVGEGIEDIGNGVENLSDDVTRDQLAN